MEKLQIPDNQAIFPGLRHSCLPRSPLSDRPVEDTDWMHSRWRSDYFRRLKDGLRMHWFQTCHNPHKGRYSRIRHSSVDRQSSQSPHGQALLFHSPEHKSRTTETERQAQWLQYISILSLWQKWRGWLQSLYFQSPSDMMLHYLRISHWVFTAKYEGFIKSS